MHRMGEYAPAWMALAVCLAGVGGCNGEGPYPVQGRLVFENDGQPVKDLYGYTVSFTSESSHQSATGDIDQDGGFRLTSRRKGDGALPGIYKVVLTQPHANPERGEYRQPVVDVIYEDPRRTNLRAKVEAKNNVFTFQLRRAMHVEHSP